MAAFRQPGRTPSDNLEALSSSQFDVLEWYPKFQSCVRYFLDHAQYSSPIQSVTAFMNIRLPYQKLQPIPSSTAAAAGSSSPTAGVSGLGRAGGSRMASLAGLQLPAPGYVTIVPYIRRMVATGFDHDGVLHGFFGDDWEVGIGPLLETERRNYLFTAKSVNWATVKGAYDMGDEETVPFLRPLQNVSEQEIQTAEHHWSQWLAMGDWMLGPRSPSRDAGRGISSEVNIKTEDD